MARRWVPSGEAPPEILPVSLRVVSQTHPVLARWLYDLPHGQASAIIRDILDSVARTGSYQATPATPAAPLTVANLPVSDPVSPGATATRANTTVVLNPPSPVLETSQAAGTTRSLNDEDRSNLELLRGLCG